MRELALFAGAGGGILGGHLLGWECVCAVEINDYARRVLLARQRDGMLPRFPIWDDVTTFDGTQWHGRVDVISGGFPCQDISAAGRGAGITGARSGLWSHMARIIGQVRPRYVFVENSPMLVLRGLDVVLSDLAALGYDAAWDIVGAHHVGAPHKRDRIWIVANTQSSGLEGCGTDSRESEVSQPWSGSSLADAKGQRLKAKRNESSNGTTPGYRKTDRPGSRSQGTKSDWWLAEPNVGRVAHRVASRVDRLKAIGNGQVPAVAALAWNLLTNQLEE